MHNYTKNFYKVRANNVIFYFSFGTCVAFKELTNYKLTIHENVWSRSTGAHLNMIDKDKSIRVDRAIFNDILEDVLTDNNLLYIPKLEL